MALHITAKMIVLGVGITVLCNAQAMELSKQSDKRAGQASSSSSSASEPLDPTEAYARVQACLDEKNPVYSPLKAQKLLETIIEQDILAPREMVQAKYQLACLYCSRAESEKTLLYARNLFGAVRDSGLLQGIDLAHTLFQRALLYKNGSESDDEQKYAQNLFRDARATLNSLLSSSHTTRAVRMRAQYLLARLIAEQYPEDKPLMYDLLKIAIASGRLNEQEHVDAQYLFAGCCSDHEEGYASITRRIKLLKAVIASGRLSAKKMAYAQLALGKELEKIYCTPTELEWTKEYLVAKILFKKEADTSGPERIKKAKAYALAGGKNLLLDIRELLAKAIASECLDVPALHQAKLLQTRVDAYEEERRAK